MVGSGVGAGITVPDDGLGVREELLLLLLLL